MWRLVAGGRGVSFAVDCPPCSAPHVPASEIPLASARSVCFFQRMSILPAIYEKGVFRPLCEVQLPEHTRVDIPVPDDVHLPETGSAQDAVYAAMKIHFRSGRNDLAARHNEHQP